MKVINKIMFILGLFLLTLIELMVLSKIFVPKRLSNTDNMYTYIIKGFYKEKKNSLDVMFMGNSDTYRGIAPIELWDQYGIASYAYSSPGQRMWTGYYILKDTLKYQHPEVIFFNVDSLFNETKSSDNNYRKVFDDMPNYSKAKFEAVNDKVFNFDKPTKISFYFPIFRYHSRYNDLKKEDFEYAFHNYNFDYKGMDLVTTSVPQKKGNAYLDRNLNAKIPSNCKKYLDKIIALCKKENIDIVLFELPSADSWTNKRHDETVKYAKSKNVEFIDLNYKMDETGFNWLEDTSDGGDHLNVYGATKVTRYLGKYINENYKIKDRRKDPKYKSWHKSSQKYHRDVKLKEDGKLSNI